MWVCEFLADGYIRRVMFRNRQEAERYQDHISKIFGVSSVVHKVNSCPVL